MVYSLEPAYLVQNELTRLIMKASMDPVNKWFFADGCFIAYLESVWSKPLNIISNFRLIIFNKNKGYIVSKAIFEYFDYMFEARGCRAFNWFVAEKNFHACRVYEKFTSHYFGHVCGRRHSGQMAYNGEISDIILYEVTSEEYFRWKNLR